MKMNRILRCLGLGVFFTSSVIAQDLSPNMSKANIALAKRLHKQDLERASRIKTYLQAHKTAKAVLVNDGVTITAIYDVINGQPIYRSTDNLSAARATKTSKLWDGGSLGLSLDGSGMTVGVWDGGPADASHPEFQNATNTQSRVTIVDNGIANGGSDNGNGFSAHGTHVSGTVASKGARAEARGMASGVSVLSYNWDNDVSEMLSAANSLNNPIILSNHSYGVPINFSDGSQLGAEFIGSYSQAAYDIDDLVKNNPQYLPVMSAGNSGQVSYTGGMLAGYDKLTSDKNSKNALIIANANPSVIEQPLFSGNYVLGNLTINNGSSQGPTDDLRIKPDIAADGTNLESPTPGGTYSTFSGTSMSAPNTTGTLLLLQQYYNQLNNAYMQAATLKALVCHTAIDDNAQAGPDPVFGWGFLDAEAAATTIASANNSNALINELTLNQGQEYTLTFTAQAGEKLSATIAWTDMPGQVAGATPNDQTPKLVNDLDLKISNGSTEHLPWRLEFNGSSFTNSKGINSRDNIERVDIDVPVTGTYTLTVTHKGTLQGNQGGPFDPQSQDYSLIITGNNLTLGLNDNDINRQLSVYPNPSNGSFNVKFNTSSEGDGTVSIDVFDIQGRLVYDNIFSNTSALFNEKITLTHAKSGVYLVNITEGNRTTSHKLVIQ